MSESDQLLLSKFGAGDPDDVPLSLPEEGVDLEAQREVEEYAERVTTGGWEFLSVSNDRVNWWNPDGPGTYWLERKQAGWNGKYGGNDARPNYTKDLQAALDAAGAFLAEHSIEDDSEVDR